MVLYRLCQRNLLPNQRSDQRGSFKTDPPDSGIRRDDSEKNTAVDVPLHDPEPHRFHHGNLQSGNSGDNGALRRVGLFKAVGAQDGRSPALR